MSVSVGICKLVNGNIPPKSTTAEEVESFKAHRKRCYEEQVGSSR